MVLLLPSVWTPDGAVNRHVGKRRPRAVRRTRGEGMVHAQRHARIHAPRINGAYVARRRPVPRHRVGERNRDARRQRVTGVGVAAIAGLVRGRLVSRRPRPGGRSTASTTPHGAMALGDFGRAHSRRTRRNRVCGNWRMHSTRRSSVCTTALERQRRFTADASHELRTPLT